MIVDYFVEVIVVLLLTLLLCTAVAIVRMRDLWAAVMLTGVYSFIGAGWMLELDAPDVAFTEAAVGAGISTFLMLATLSLTSKIAKDNATLKLVPLLVVTFTGGLLIYGTFDMPYLGDPSAPIHQFPSPSYIDRVQHEGPDHEAFHGIPNIVTVVLASYRGYDTLGETVVVFTAGIGVLVLLRRDDEEQAE